MSQSHVIQYMGAKNRLKDWIVSSFPKNYKSLHYVEAFFGSGAVFFRKERSALETINDLDSNIYNLFKVLRDDFDKLNHLYQNTLYCEETFKEAKQLWKDNSIDPIKKAWATLVVYNQSFGGTSSGFGYNKNIAGRIGGNKFSNKIRSLPLFSKRVQDAQIFNKPAEEVIKQFDSKDTLFYLDPPYPETSQTLYKNKYSNKDFNHLIKLLQGIKGKFLLSFYSKDWMEIPTEWTVLKKSTQLACSSQRQAKGYFKHRVETMIKNY